MTHSKHSQVTICSSIHLKVFIFHASSNFPVFHKQVIIHAIPAFHEIHHSASVFIFPDQNPIYLLPFYESPSLPILILVALLCTFFLVLAKAHTFQSQRANRLDFLDRTRRWNTCGAHFRASRWSC